MQATDCPYCAVRIPPGAETCAICKHPLPPALRRDVARPPEEPRARARLRMPAGGPAAWDLLAGGAALFLAMVGVTLVIALL